MASGQQPSPLAEEEIQEEGLSRRRRSEQAPGMRTDTKRARSRDLARTVTNETRPQTDVRSRSPLRDPAKYSTAQSDGTPRDTPRDPSPGPNTSSSGSSRRTPRSPITMTISSSGRTSSSPSPSPTSQSSPTRRSRTSPASAGKAPMLGRSQSYITTATNQMTSSALVSGHGHMMAGASEPNDIRRSRSNSHSATTEDARPTMFTRPSLGGRAASSAAVIPHRSGPQQGVASAEPQRPDLSPPPRVDMPGQRYPLNTAPSFSPESDRDSGEMSPDADDEASPVHSPSTAMETLSLSPAALRAQETDAEWNRNDDQESLATSATGFGLPRAQAGANVSFPSMGTSLEIGDEEPPAGGGEVDPDVEGIPEALSMPRDLMPSEDAFEDEGLTTLERIFLLSRSEHAFHR